MKKDIKKYVDILVAQEKARMCRSMFGVEVCNGLDYTVQTNSGIEILASAVEQNVCVDENFTKANKCKHFSYNGVKFIELEAKEKTNEI